MSSSLNSIDWQYIIGGISLFLFGINLMGENLTKIAGNKLRDLIEKYTSNPIIGILIGIGITGVIQSSTATTVIAISLVRSGLMRLDQAIGITLGANIGTTVTAILIGFNLNKISFYILFIGLLLLLFHKKSKTLYLSQIIIGFSLLFIGLNMMEDALKNLQYIEGFETAIATLSNTPFIGIIVGAISTIILQSSSAVVGIIQKLFDTNSIDLIAAIALVGGANIGTTLTAILASVGGSNASNRTSLFHLIFNASVSFLLLFFITPYSFLIQQLSIKFNINNLMTIAIAHFLFNFIGTLIYIPLIKPVTKLLEKIVPGKDVGDLDDTVLDETVAHQSAAIALRNSKEAIIKMADLTLVSINISKTYLIKKDNKYFDEANNIERIINSLDTKITKYLILISKQNISEELIVDYSKQLQIIKNYERIADLAVNLSEYYDMIFIKDEDFDEITKNEILDFYNLLIENFELVTKMYKDDDLSNYSLVTDNEKNINLFSKELENTFFNKISSKYEKASVAGALFIDILGTMERMADHAFNIAQIMKDPIKRHNEKK